MSDQLPTRNPRPSANSTANGYVLPETVLLAAIGCLDLLTTVYWMGSGYAYEGNPIMSCVLRCFGPRGFAAAKGILLALPLTAAEYARKRNEPFVRSALRVCIALYVTIYALMFARYDSARLLALLWQ